MAGLTVSPARAHAAVETYLGECSALAETGAGTDERSFYPAINKLLTSLGELGRPAISAVSDPAGPVVAEGFDVSSAKRALPDEQLVLHSPLTQGRASAAHSFPATQSAIRRTSAQGATLRNLIALGAFFSLTGEGAARR